MTKAEIAFYAERLASFHPELYMEPAKKSNYVSYNMYTGCPIFVCFLRHLDQNFEHLTMLHIISFIYFFLSGAPKTKHYRRFALAKNIKQPGALQTV